MSWNIIYDKLVWLEDLKDIDPFHRKRIIRVINKKLSTAPSEYGVPLRGRYHGFWKLPVGDWRVVYSIKKDKVLVYVIKIGKRRDDIVYNELYYRLRKLGY